MSLHPFLFNQRLILALFCTLFTLSACTNNESSLALKGPVSLQSSLVATVDGAPITAFMVERESRFGIDKKVNPSQILTWKIYEHTIASSQRAKGLTSNKQFLDASKAFLHEALVEEVFTQEVSQKVEVTDNEIKAEIAKRNVRFAFRFFPLEDEQDGLKKREIWLNHSYDSLISSVKISTNEVAALSQQWQSPLINAYDIDPDLLMHLQNLPIGEPSLPLLYQGKWMLFEVTDIRRTPVGDWDYNDQWESAKKVVWNTKAITQATSFVDSLMKPLQVRTHRAVFEKLATTLYPVLKAQTPVRSLAYLIQHDAYYREALQPLSVEQKQVLSSWDGGEITVFDFLTEWVPGLYPLRFDSQESFNAALSDAIALVVRDKKLLEKARLNPSIKNDSLLAEIRLREDKWLFQQYKNEQLASIIADPSSLKKWYENQTQKRGLQAKDFTELDEVARLRLAQRRLAIQLEEQALVLRNTTSIVHYEDQWKALENRLSKDAASVDNYPNKTVQIFKNYANRPAWPAIDTIWLQLPS